MRHFLKELSLLKPASEAAPHLRSFVLTRTWSRTYKHHDFYIDLFFSGNRYGAVLEGQVLGCPASLAGKIKFILLHSSDEDFYEEAPLDAHGKFRFAAEQAGDYQLVLELDGKVAEVDTIAVK